MHRNFHVTELLEGSPSEEFKLCINYVREIDNPESTLTAFKLILPQTIFGDVK